MQKNIIRLAIGTLLLLLIPLALTIHDGNVPNVGWNWGSEDFIFAFIMIFGTGLAYLLITRKPETTGRYKLIVGTSLAIVFALAWIQAAVGLID